MIGAEPSCWAAKNLTEEVSCEKTAVSCAAIGVCDPLCPKPIRRNLISKLDTAKFPTQPDQYWLRNKTYECLTCVPKVAVKADGSDQKVTGHP